MTDKDQVDVTAGVDEIEDIDDAAQTRPASVGLKEMWASNPLLKIAAVVVAIGVFVGAYLTFFGGKEADTGTKTAVGGLDAAGATTVAGQGEVDAEYRKALEEANKQRADQAAQTGGSAMPTPIDTSASENIQLPATTNVQEQEDPLREWRARNEQRQADEPIDLGEEQATIAPQPEVIPLVQPIRPQVEATVNPEAAQALSEQMRVIVAAQAPETSTVKSITGVPSAYAIKRDEDKAKRQAQLASNGAVVATDGGATTVTADGQTVQVKPKVIVPAGSIVYAQLLNELNSDIKGPVLAQILSGPFEGGRAIGSFETRDEYLVLSFKRIVKQGISYSVDGIALNENTTLAAHQSDVDYHYFSRVILPAAAKFIEGYGSAVAETGTTTETTAGGGVVQSEPEPDANEEALKGVEEASKKLSEIFDESADRPITVKVSRGTTMGILFMEQVTTANAQ